MQYFPLTNKHREEIKKEIGIDNLENLFSDIPKEKAWYSLEDIPSSLPENELFYRFKEYSEKNTYPEYMSFLGAGAYNHFIPEVVNYLSQRSEFLTPYTPYQPEVSQGSLQAMFEYQTMMAMLTGMDIANASLYDGGTAAIEGALLALRKSRKNKILIAENLHPEYIEIVKSYIQNLGIELKQVAYDRKTGKVDIEDLKGKLDDDSGCFLFQSPNFFGQIEDNKEISEIVHSVKKAVSVQVTAEAMSLPFLKPAGEQGVDIIVGEAQSFGLPMSFGGPFLGFIAAKKDFLRQMPGRLVGETKDVDGRRGFVLTLSTREQHIKREKATSNICSNQAWCALRAGIFLATLGKKGLLKISKLNHLNTAYFAKNVEKLSNIKVKYKENFFNEVVLETVGMTADEFLKGLKDNKILAGIPLNWFYKDADNLVLINFTEMHKKEDIDKLIKAIGELR